VLSFNTSKFGRLIADWSVGNINPAKEKIFKKIQQTSNINWNDLHQTI